MVRKDLSKKKSRITKSFKKKKKSNRKKINQQNKEKKFSLKNKKKIQHPITKNLNKFNNNISFFPKVKRLIAIGDLHGDLEVLLKSLSIPKLISPNFLNKDINVKEIDINTIKWIGKDAYVVQIGDQIDRLRNEDDLKNDEGSDLKILNLLKNLDNQAKKSNGRILCIFGNHEIMNFDGDFRYVSPEEFKEFQNFCEKDSSCTKSQPGYAERLNAFKRGGILSKQLNKTHNTIICVGSWLFVHAGITKELADKYSIKEINTSFSNWIAGKNDEKMQDLYFADNDILSPVWNREYSDEEDWKGPDNFYEAIKKINSKNKKDLKIPIKCMVVGHTPQCFNNRGINSACKYRLWRIDAGMSQAFGKKDTSGNRKVQILEIKNDNRIKILHE